MSHNTRVRADYAAWAIGTGVSAAEFEKFDANLFKAINGDEGGTWAPSAVITIGGSGMQFSGSKLSVDPSGEFAVYCESYFGDAARFAGIVTTENAVTMNGAVTVNSDASFTGSVTIGDSPLDALVVNADQNYSGPEQHNGEVEFRNTVILSPYAPLGAAGGLSSLGNTTLGNSPTQTLTVGATSTFNAAETHNGTETHNGSETHAGTVAFNGPVSAAAGMHRVTYGGGLINTDQSITWDDPECLTYTTTTNGLAIILQANGTTPNGVVKSIKNSFLSTYNIMVVNASTAQQIGLIAPGVTATFRSAGGAWL